ncbi:hypothetical protein NDU88_007582 [Pleurodeles waltl]|uniref:Uncharacterized protein n=1 Tax=Pleurodeles waltl TaxID=8319 RepID=A0AAV7VU34_PLEWA|nr:hypothetical protein NDU88_007582 [Pleurodeles waltl]
MPNPLAHPGAQGQRKLTCAILGCKKEDDASEGESSEEKQARSRRPGEPNEDDQGERGYTGADGKTEGLSKEKESGTSGARGTQRKLRPRLRESAATSGTKNELQAQTETLKEEKRVNRQKQRKRTRYIYRKKPKAHQRGRDHDGPLLQQADPPCREEETGTASSDPEVQRATPNPLAHPGAEGQGKLMRAILGCKKEDDAAEGESSEEK